MLSGTRKFAATTPVSHARPLLRSLNNAHRVPHYLQPLLVPPRVTRFPFPFLLGDPSASTPPFLRTPGMSEYDDIIGSGDVPLVHDARPWLDRTTLGGKLGVLVLTALSAYLARWIAGRFMESSYRKCAPVTRQIGVAGADAFSQGDAAAAWHPGLGQPPVPHRAQGRAGGEDGKIGETASEGAAGGCPQG